DRNLKPNGRFLLHTIGSKVTDHNVDPWIDKYIFPNGCLPSAPATFSSGRWCSRAVLNMDCASPVK
ncbi:class I SAM-dependent methyltransferase, partial [Acinetobacter baumannii]|uniref:class I SAM-dependent methyltransferase n=1 Tax=Acinetobacter baumannii TaxID=470 RepID=UPI002FE0D6B8